MKEILLSNNVKIPMVGYGSYLSTEKGGKQVILEALEAGYRYIDTASFYYNEDAIGEAISDSGISRNDIFICSKVWPTMFGTKETRESFEQSCEKLRTDYLDMFLLHWPRASVKDEKWFEKAVAAWKVLEELYDEGRVKAIGVSNFLPHHLAPFLEAIRIKPMVDQLELHVGYMQEYTLAFLRKEGIVPQAWSPLGRAKMLGDERILKLSEKYGKSPAQILLNFLIQREIPVIPKASRLDRMKDNMNIFDFSLTEEEVSYLSCIPEAGWSGEHPDTFEY